VPSLAWVPLLILWLGIGEGPKLTLIAIGAFFPSTPRSSPASVRSTAS
jgi:sulfonate transport system permease protein